MARDAAPRVGVAAPGALWGGIDRRHDSLALGDRIVRATLHRDANAEPLALLAPLAAAAGSEVGARLLNPSGPVLWLLGRSTLQWGAESVDVPAGKPGELLRLVAVHPRGVAAEQAIDLLWPSATPMAGPKNLRNALHRLHAAAGPGLVLRDGARLRVGAVWSDASAFLALAAGVADRGTAPSRDSRLHAALALWAAAPLPDDLYHDWSVPIRGQLEQEHARLSHLASAG